MNTSTHCKDIIKQFSTSNPLLTTNDALILFQQRSILPKPSDKKRASVMRKSLFPPKNKSEQKPQELKKPAIHIGINVELLTKPTSSMQNALILTLTISSIDELTSFSSFCTSSSDKQMLQKIKYLDLSKIDINAQTKDNIEKLLALILQSNEMPKFTDLCLGDIENGIIFTLPNLANLKSLSVGDIDRDAIFYLPLLVNNLQSLYIGNVSENAKFVLLPTLSTLTTFSIGNVENGAIMQLSNSLQNVTHFTRGTIYDNTLLFQLKSVQERINLENSSISRKPYELYCDNPNQPFLNRLCTRCPNLLVDILFKSKLSTILVFKQISKGFYHFTSSIHPNQTNTPLMKRVVIHFDRQSHQLLKKDTLSIDENAKLAQLRSKLHFAEMYTKLSLTITLNDLQNPSQLMQRISKPRLALVLEIQNLDEVTQFYQLLSTSANKTLFDIICQLDLRQIILDQDMNQPINDLLAIIATNKQSLVSLQSLIFGNIQNVKIVVPEELENLRSITIGNSEKSSVILPKALNNLKALFIGNIDATSNILIPDQLPSLKHFSIGYISNKQFKLPFFMPKLQHFVISLHGIHQEGIFDKSYIFHNLKTLIIQEVQSESIINLGNLSEQFPHLKTLQISNIGVKAIVNLFEPSNTLEHLSVENICSNALLQLPEFLYNLKTLFVQSIIHEKAAIRWPQNLPNLTILNMSGIKNEHCLQLPKHLDNVKLLIIENLHVNFNFSQLELPQLLFLKINNIDQNVDLQLPALNLLNGIAITNIKEGAKIHLPKQLNQLQLCLIDNIEKNAIIELPLIAHKVLNYYLTNLQDGATIQNLPTNWSLNLNEGSNYIPDVYQSVTKMHFPHIPKNSSLTFSKKFDHLTELSFGTIEQGAKIQFPESYNNLAKLAYLEDKRSMTDRLPLLYLQFKLMLYNNKFTMVPFLFCSLLVILNIMFRFF